MAWSGILCDVCGERIPEFRVDADVETRGGTVRVTVDYCQVCVALPDQRVVTIYHMMTYSEPE